MDWTTLITEPDKDSRKYAWSLRGRTGSLQLFHEQFVGAAIKKKKS